MIKKLMNEPEYRLVDAISYSELAGVDKTPANIITKHKLDSDGIKFGSALDTYIFDGEEDFKKKFVIMTEKLPSPIIKSIIDGVFTIANNNLGFAEELKSLEDYKDYILMEAKAKEYGASNWKDDTIVNKITTDGGKDYFDLLVRACNRSILDSFTFEQILNSTNTLLTHEFTKDKFSKKEGCDIFYQFPIFWEYTNTEGKVYKCKSLLDILEIDWNNKIIYPRDLKSMGDHVLSFGYGNYMKFRYFLQESYYTDAVHWFKNNTPELKDFEVAPFEFIVISSQDYSRPLVYKGTQDTYNVGRFGGIIQGREVKGYEQLIFERDWHIENDKYSFPYEIYKNNGEIKLSL